jgi:hypothetical protein
MKFEPLLNPTRGRWPKKGDRPFRAARDAQVGARLADHPIPRAVHMMDGFMSAGATLADQAAQHDFRRHDLIYPSLYCYRHAIELGLKWLVGMYGPAVGVAPENLDATHDLWGLWKSFLLISQAYGESADNEASKAVGQIIKQFHDWDGRSDAFRYATNRQGGVAKFQNYNIDLNNLKDVMAGVTNFFTGADGFLDQMSDV